MPEYQSALAAQYSVWLRNPTGTRFKLVDSQADIIRLEYVRVLNSPGVLSARLKSTFDLSQIQEDSQLEVIRRLPSGEQLDTNAIWFIRNWAETLTEKREQFVEISLAKSAMMLLDTRIIAYASGTAQASKTDQADDMIKAIVRENLGSSAIAARQISYLSVAADQGLGPNITKSFAWDNVLDICKEIASDAAQQGTNVYFDIDGQAGSTSLTFNTYINQRGVNRGQTSNQRLILSNQNGTLTDIRREYLSGDENNYCYVGGQDTGSNRNIVEVSDSTRTGISPFNRREIFYNGSQTNDDNTLTSLGYSTLRQNKPRQKFTAKIVDTPAIRYGRDYNFGDRVIVQHNNFVADAIINEVRVLLERQKETIKIGLLVV